MEHEPHFSPEEIWNSLSDTAKMAAVVTPLIPTEGEDLDYIQEILGNRVENSEAELDNLCRVGLLRKIGNRYFIANVDLMIYIREVINKW